MHRLRLENRSAAEATRTRIAIQVKYGTNDQKHRGCLADAEEQPHQQTVGHDDLRLVPQSSGIEQVEHRLGKRSRKSGLFLFFQTIRSRAQVPLTINPGSQGSRGFRIAERAPSLRRNIFRLRLGGRKPPFAESASGRAWNSRTGTPYIRRIGRWTLTLSARLSVLFAVSFTPEQAAPKPSRASSAVMILAFIFLVLSVTFLAEFTDKYMHNFAFFHESVQKTSQKVLTFNCFYFTLPDKSIILFL